jgi:hypothetical protein
MCLPVFRKMLFHLRRTFITSSYHIEVLGGENVDLEMLIFFGKIWRKSVKPFSKAGAKKTKIVHKIRSRLEILKMDGVKIVFDENNLSKYDSSN